MRRLVPVAAIVIIAAAVTVLLVTRDRTTKPHLLGDDSTSNISVDMAPQPLRAATLYVAAALPDLHGHHSETITFRSARAHLVENSAAATATVAICSRRDGMSMISAINTRAVGRMDHYCDPLRPIHRGTTMQWQDGDPHHVYLLLIITPTRPGVAKVDRITYDYAREDKFHQAGKDVAVVNARLTATR